MRLQKEVERPGPKPTRKAVAPHQRIPLSSPAALQLQRTIGNRRTRHFIARLQFDRALLHFHIPYRKNITLVKGQGQLRDGTYVDIVIAQNAVKQPNMLSALKYAAERFEEVAKSARAVVAAAGGFSGMWRHPAQPEPFVYKIVIPFDDGRTERWLTLVYQVAAASPGYIIRQEVSNENESAIANVAADQTIGFSPTFSSTHANTGKERLSSLTNQSSKLTHAENEKRIDARAKLAGEGARFKVVRNNMNTIADESRIWTVAKGTVHYVTLRDLWNNWDQVFDSEYGISDSAIAAALLSPSRWRVDYAPKFTALKNFNQQPIDIRIEQ